MNVKTFAAKLNTLNEPDQKHELFIDSSNGIVPIDYCNGLIWCGKADIDKENWKWEYTDGFYVITNRRVEHYTHKEMIREVENFRHLYKREKVKHFDKGPFEHLY